MQLLGLIVLSSVIPSYARDERLDLIRSSRSALKSIGITGLFLDRDGDILQIIEGLELAALGMLGRIRSDPRHRGVFVAIDEPIEKRQFSDWRVAFHDPSLTAGEMPGFDDLMNLPHPETRLGACHTKANAFLRSFLRSAVEPTFSLAA